MSGVGGKKRLPFRTMVWFLPVLGVVVLVLRVWVFVPAEVRVKRVVYAARNAVNELSLEKGMALLSPDFMAQIGGKAMNRDEFRSRAKMGIESLELILVGLDELEIRVSADKESARVRISASALGRAREGYGFRIRKGEIEAELGLRRSEKGWRITDLVMPDRYF